MLVIENITLSDRAAAEFHRQRLAFKAEPGEVFALVRPAFLSRSCLAMGIGEAS